MRGLTAEEARVLRDLHTAQSRDDGGELDDATIAVAKRLVRRRLLVTTTCTCGCNGIVPLVTDLGRLALRVSVDPVRR